MTYSNSALPFDSPFGVPNRTHSGAPVPQFRLFEAAYEQPLTKEQASQNFWMAILNSRIFNAIAIAPLIRANYRYVPETEVHSGPWDTYYVLPAGSIVETDRSAFKHRIGSSMAGYKSAGILKTTANADTDWVHVAPLCPGRAGRPTRAIKTAGFSTMDPEVTRLKRARYMRVGKQDVSFGWAMAILKHSSLDPLLPMQYAPRFFGIETLRRTVTNSYYHNVQEMGGTVDIHGNDAITFDRYIFNKAMAGWLWYPENLELQATNQGITADGVAISGELDGRIIGDKGLMRALNFNWLTDITSISGALGERIGSAKY